MISNLTLHFGDRRIIGHVRFFFVGNITRKNLPTTASQQRGSLKHFLLDSNKLIVLNMINIEVSVHDGSSRRIVVIRHLTTI